MLAHALGGTPHPNGVTCTHDGTLVDYRFTDRGSGSHTEYWTQIEAALPRAYPLELRVVPGRTDPAAVRRGEVIDIEVGHPMFDPWFHVEGAPSDVIARLLDTHACGFLMGYSHVELETFRDGARTGLRFATKGWREEPRDAHAMIAEVTRIARRVRDVYAELDAVNAPRETGSPYRPQLDDRPQRDAAATREAELANLAAVRAANERGHVFNTILLGGVLVLVILGILAASTP